MSGFANIDEQNAAYAAFPIPLYAMCDVWQALGGDPSEFDRWVVDDLRRTPADSWSQLTAAIGGDLMTGDHNPPPGALRDLVERLLSGGRTVV